MNTRNLAILVVASVVMSACKTHDDRYAVNGSNYATADIVNQGACPFDANAKSTASFENKSGSMDWRSACIYEPLVADKAFIIYRKNVSAVAYKEGSYTVEKKDFDGNTVTETKTTKTPYSIGSTATFTNEQVFYENQDCSGTPIGTMTSNGSVKVDGFGYQKSPDPLYAPVDAYLKVTYTIEPITSSVAGVTLKSVATAKTTVKDIMYASCAPQYNRDTGVETNVYSRGWWRGDPFSGLDAEGYPKVLSQKSAVYIVSK